MIETVIFKDFNQDFTIPPINTIFATKKRLCMNESWTLVIEPNVIEEPYTV